MTVRIKTIYLDMDGVLANFDERWRELFQESPAETRSRKNFSPNWDEFVNTEQFATLPTFPGWDVLLNKVMSYNVNVEILSSSGGQKYHLEVSDQKRRWLKANGINVPANFVPGRKLKANYATANSLLIDDTPDVIMGFFEAGGHSILHDSAERTIMLMESFFQDISVY